LCGIAVVVGHIYPIWYSLRGGKGVATLVGTVLGIDVWLLLPMLFTWLAAVVLSGYVGLASIIAAVSLPIVVVWHGYEPHTPMLVFGFIAAVLIVFTHRSNIMRMRAGIEPRAQRLWLLGRIRK
jgi:glycerol-3-phosphate acyltransferase PlsY